MNFTSDDGALIKLLILLIVFEYSFRILYGISSVIFNGCYFLITHFFMMLVSLTRILILFNLIGIAMLCQKYQSATTVNQKNKMKRNLVASCLTLWVISMFELNSMINDQYSDNTLIRFMFQIICGSSLIIGITLYYKSSSSASFHRTRSNETRSCPICMDDIIDGVTINECNHSICLNNHCGYNYIKHSIVDITKYPITCFQHDCNSKIHKDAIKHIINYQIKQNSNNNGECQQLLQKYHRFSVITSTPKHLRIDCPNADCNNVLIKTEPPLNKQFSSLKYPSYGNTSHYKSLNSARACQSDLCTHSFSVLKWRYHCTICGDIFCYQCVRFKMQILELGYIEPVNLCMICFTNLFCIQCDECKTMICYQCESPWHNVMDKNDVTNGICKKIIANDNKTWIDAKTKRLMKQNNFQKCPRCGMMIEKASGCNHMTHSNCPHKTESNGTHFCYTCGDVLYGRYHNEERDGIRHFPNGVYKKCRKAKKSASQNCIVM